MYTSLFSLGGVANRSQVYVLHRYDSSKSNRQNTRIYKEMTDKGRDNFYIELIEDYPCENIYQLRKKVN